jgi:hypothetical protein
MGKPTKSKALGWLQLNATVLAIAFALTLAAAIYAYTVNASLDVPQLLFLLLVFYALAAATRWVWERIKNSRRGQS